MGYPLTSSDEFESKTNNWNEGDTFYR